MCPEAAVKVLFRVVFLLESAGKDLLSLQELLEFISLYPISKSHIALTFALFAIVPLLRGIFMAVDGAGRRACA